MRVILKLLLPLFLLPTLPTQSQDRSESGIGCNDNWGEMVITLKDGNKLTFQRSAIAKVTYRSATPTDLNATLTSGKAFDCEQRPEGGKVTYSCTIRISSYDPSSGAIVGALSWSLLGSVQRIHGFLVGNQLSFAAEAIPGRNRHVDIDYKLAVLPNSAEGTFVDAADKMTGTMIIRIQ